MTAQTSPPPANLFSNFIDIIAAPATALRRISTHHPRSWWAPALLAAAAPTLYLWLTRELAAELAMRQIELQLSAMPPEQVEAARPMLERFQTPEFIFFTGAGALLLGLILAWLLSTFIIYFGASLSGSTLKVNRLWPVIVWSWLPFALRGMLQSAWAAITGNMVTYSGLSYFVASGDTTADQTNLLFNAASQIDLFALWHLLLIYLLLRHVARMGGGSSFLLTLLYALINLGLRLAPVALGSAFAVG